VVIGDRPGLPYNSKIQDIPFSQSTESYRPSPEFVKQFCFPYFSNFIHPKSKSTGAAI